MISFSGVLRNDGDLSALSKLSGEVTAETSAEVDATVGRAVEASGTTSRARG